MSGGREQLAQDSPRAISQGDVAATRARNDQFLLTVTPSTSSTSLRAEVDVGDKSVVPHALRKCDGADIIKKNTARKKKYLFALPGGASFPVGCRVGTLSGLDTTTPYLDVDYPEGRLRLFGKLLFPRNAMLALKGSASRRKGVMCTDSFDTIVMFSQWAWLGDISCNPGEVAKPLPPSMKSANVGSVWRGSSGPRIQLERMCQRDLSSQHGPTVASGSTSLNPPSPVKSTEIPTESTLFAMERNGVATSTLAQFGSSKLQSTNSPSDLSADLDNARSHDGKQTSSGMNSKAQSSRSRKPGRLPSEGSLDSLGNPGSSEDIKTSLAAARPRRSNSKRFEMPAPADVNSVNSSDEDDGSQQIRDDIDDSLSESPEDSDDADFIVE